MVFIRCVGHAINVPSTFVTVLTSDVGTGIATDACLTFSTTILEKSLCMGTVWMVEPPGYTMPITTT